MKQQNKKPVVVGIGELLWDLLPTGKTAGGAPINLFTMLPVWEPKGMLSVPLVMMITEGIY